MRSRRKPRRRRCACRPRISAAPTVPSSKKRNPNSKAIERVMPTALVDCFVLDRLPPPELLPEFRFDRPEFRYPERINAGAELIDRAIAAGWGERTAIVFPGGAWTYAELARTANGLASVLRD